MCMWHVTPPYSLWQMSNLLYLRHRDRAIYKDLVSEWIGNGTDVTTHLTHCHRFMYVVIPAGPYSLSAWQSKVHPYQYFCPVTTKLAYPLMGYKVTLEHRHKVDCFFLARQPNAAAQYCCRILFVSDVNQNWHDAFLILDSDTATRHRYSAQKSAAYPSRLYFTFSPQTISIVISSSFLDQPVALSVYV